MSTSDVTAQAVAREIPETAQAVELQVRRKPSSSMDYSGSLSRSTAAAVNSFRVIERISPSVYTCTAPVDQTKSVEVIRQARRLDAYREWASREARESIDISELTKSIETAQKLLNHTLSTPIPVPVASTGADGSANLLFSDSQVYGDIEIQGDDIEYYLKEKGLKVRETYSSEVVSDNKLPYGLFAILYAMYARNA